MRSECVFDSGHAFFPAVYPIKILLYHCDVVCLSMPSNLPSHAFFLDAIEEIYDKNTSLSIYPKKIFMHLYAWPVMPYIVGGFGTRHSTVSRDATGQSPGYGLVVRCFPPDSSGAAFIWKNTKISDRLVARSTISSSPLRFVLQGYVLKDCRVHRE
jgi:hypothetical protein